MTAPYPFSTRPFLDTGRTLRGYVDLGLDFTAEFTLTIYAASSAGFATKPTDALRSQPFRGALDSYRFHRSINGAQIGTFTTGDGNLVINNADAFYDFLPLSYTVDARRIVVKLARRDGSYNDATLVARVTATGWFVDTGQVSIDLVDFAYKLDVPIQPNVYGGTGTVDGTADLAGKRIPLLLGYAREVPAVTLVPSLLIYQVHDGAIEAVVMVYDRGVALTAGADYASYYLLSAATVAPGQYATCLALGLFKLGSSPDGTVTADVQGENANGYLVTTADIVRWAIANRTTLVDPTDLDTASFDALNTSQPAPINYWIGPDDNLSVADFIANLMGGVGGWGGHKRDGLFAVRIFEAPTGTPVASYTRNDIIGDDLRREPLPAAYRPPPWRWRVPYALAWTVQTDIAGAVDAVHKAFMAEPYRLAESSSEAIKTDHPFAQDRDPVQSYFSDYTDALAEAVRRLDLFRSSRNLYRMTLPRAALALDLGDVFELTHPRFDLSFGRLLTVIELTETVNPDGLDTVEVVAYG